MDIPDVGGIADEAKKLADSQVGEALIEKAKDVLEDKVAEVKEMADKKGLGVAVDAVVNIAEEKTGVDIDGDGDVAK